jgi:hypothetical protein
MSDDFIVRELQSDIDGLRQQLTGLDTRLGEQLERERKRNDIQARRIKALVAVVEKLTHHLVTARGRPGGPLDRAR